MNLRKLTIVIFPFILISIVWGLFSCKPVETFEWSHKILAVVAHPDDETLISGTLAKLVHHGCDVTVAYITSGDDVPDMTWQGLHGSALAEVREKEAEKSLNCIGVINPPIFLRFSDSHVWKNSELIRDSLLMISSRIDPEVVITFGPDGVTDDSDHITTGFVTDQVFDNIHTGKLLLHIAISRKANRIYPNPAPVDDALIDLQVDVSDYKRFRFKTNREHRTQFGRRQRLFWKIFVRCFPFEEFVIAGNLNGEQILYECFHN